MEGGAVHQLLMRRGNANIKTIKSNHRRIFPIATNLNLMEINWRKSRFDLKCCILDDPLDVRGDASVDSRVVGLATPNAPRHDPDDCPSSVRQLIHQRTSERRMKVLRDGRRWFWSYPLSPWHESTCEAPAHITLSWILCAYFAWQSSFFHTGTETSINVGECGPPKNCVPHPVTTARFPS